MQKGAGSTAAPFSHSNKMVEMIHLLPQDGVVGSQAEGFDDDEGNDGGHTHLEQIAGDGGDGHDPVAVNDALGHIVTADLDGAGQDHGQDVEGEGFLLFR